MHVTRATKIGLTLIAIGLLPIVVLSTWRATLDDVPVLKPVSLSVGHLRQPFNLNLTGSYTIRIEAQRKLPHATLQCLLGIRDYVPEGQCKDIAAAVSISWTLTDGGQVIRTGSSATAVGGAYTNDTVANQLGWFEGKRGHHYVFEMDNLKDGSALAIANPKLRIGVDEGIYEGFIFWELLVFAWAILDCVVGGSILLVSVFKSRQKREQVSKSLLA